MDENIIIHHNRRGKALFLKRLSEKLKAQGVKMHEMSFRSGSKTLCQAKRIIDEYERLENSWVYKEWMK